MEGMFRRSKQGECLKLDLQANNRETTLGGEKRWIEI
jgi:hypothetical protein